LIIFRDPTFGVEIDSEALPVHATHGADDAAGAGSASSFATSGGQICNEICSLSCDIYKDGRIMLVSSSRLCWQHRPRVYGVVSRSSTFDGDRFADGTSN